MSGARAKAVHDYVVGQGIDASRLQYRGFGESQPMTTNETEEGRQSNRRTEVMVVK